MIFKRYFVSRRFFHCR